ncbi:MAG: hypothetical protein AUJ52_05180 [Elusimicrobia bacterium CG1_02_63_36]|nr:MAG: hypothetical protein AUJ52_05180 [Elusimicrobia bacterium CG1_02_63_36]PIP82941.1 MAG: hypothetical protein COR54_12165 [Elusimicrobia bacterium CG22_combo_CG10-13_8_21_14_all_63_91]PJA15857.1 MAG: hypothetical protein COX66_09065 [Elusimicrobia bacterium CG_4_10_14_0_2_um_filter_63_34]PJB25343.1 MAG: hypothetical protein CO113_09190 [Elusimicrobia bacterium CG_4_9_14_3_um_filter_62_55]
MVLNENDERPLVVWVEDDPDFQDIVRDWLIPRYDLITYKDGGAFLDEIAESEPAVIMLDVGLPGPDGFKLCRAVRRDRRLAATPILFLTSCQEDVDYVKHLKVGGTAFLTKPVDRKELLSTLDELVLKKYGEPL